MLASTAIAWHEVGQHAPGSVTGTSSGPHMGSMHGSSGQGAQIGQHCPGTSTSCVSGGHSIRPQLHAPPVPAEPPVVVSPPEPAPPLPEPPDAVTDASSPPPTSTCSADPVVSPPHAPVSAPNIKQITGPRTSIPDMRGAKIARRTGVSRRPGVSSAPMLAARVSPVWLVCALLGCSSGSRKDAAEDASTTSSFDGAPDVSPGARREEAWVSNSGETTLSVIDHETRAVVATVQIGTPDDGGVLHGIAHGIAVARTGDVVYAGTEDTGEVVAIDTRTRSVAWRLHAGTNFQLGTLTADDRYLFVPDLFAGRVVVIDTKTRSVEREIAMLDPADAAGTPMRGLHNMYTSDDGTTVFATAIFGKQIARIDVSSRQIQRVYAIAGEPRPLALTHDLSKMYVQLSDLQGFIAVDLETGAETARVEIPDDGARPPGWDGWTFAHGIYLTRDESELWVDSVVAGKVYVYSVPALEQLATLDVGVMPRWFGATEDETTLYLSNTTPAEDHGTVSVIDRVARKVVATLDVGKAPKDVHMVRVPW